MPRSVWFSFVFLLFVSACASDVAIREPVPEPDVVEGSNIDLQQLWRRSYTANEDLPTGVFRPALMQETLYIATNKGVVAALDLSGQELWSQDLQETLSTGIAVSSQGAVVVSRRGDVIALDAAGEELWRQSLAQDIIQVPVIHRSKVFLQASNASIFTLDMATGEVLWQYKGRSPALTLRGTSQPLPYKDRLLVSLDSGALIALSLESGQLLWERKLRVPKGTNEFERMVDLDGRMTLKDNIVFVPGYQGYLSAVEAYTGQVLWQKELSSAMRPAFSVDRLYIADADSQLLMLDYRSGEVKWQSDQLKYRDLGETNTLGVYVLSTDLSGQVYVIDKSNAHIVAKAKVGDPPVQLLTAEDRVFAQSANGKVKALELQELKSVDD